MFIFPWCVINDEIKVLSDDQRTSQIGMTRTDHMRYMNVPFAINIMSGGQYEEKQNISFSGVSAEKKVSTLQVHDGESEDGNMIFPSEWGVKMHSHDYYELMYVLEGSVEQQIENKIYTYKKGEGCFINRNTRHCEISGKDFIVAYLCLSKEYIQDTLCANHRLSGPIYRFLSSSLDEKSSFRKDYLHIVPSGGGDGTERVYCIIDQMTKELMNKVPGYVFIFHGLVERLFGEFQDKNYHQITYISLNTSVEDQLFDKVKQLVEENPGKYTRQGLADELNYSGDYLNRIVKKYTGLPITKYCQKISLLQAKKMLVETDSNVSEVMEKLGFKNASYFYELFKEEYGILPGEFKKANAKK